MIINEQHSRGDCGILFWRPNEAGYTYDVDRAGRYTLEQARQIHSEQHGTFAVPEAEIISRVKRVVDSDHLSEILKCALTAVAAN